MPDQFSDCGLTLIDHDPIPGCDCGNCEDLIEHHTGETGNTDRPEDEEGCVFPGHCCMPGFHRRSECYTAEMAEEWDREALRDAERGVL